ncbi:MAG TPA: hypothetical protein VH332_10500 [Nitrospira sp.]
MPLKKIHVCLLLYLRSNSYAGLIMRIVFRHHREIMELLEGINEEALDIPEAKLLRMCRV